MINEHAIVDSSARIAADVTIGPWTIIGENVHIDSGTTIASHVVIQKNTRIGKNNRIFSHAVLGTDPQQLVYRDEDTWLEMGDNNIIREFVTINRGTGDGGITKIANHCYLMSYAHIAHDCVIGDHVIFANNASIAGHVTVNHHANLGPFSGIHQFVSIGEYSFLGRATKIYQDILPYMLVTGNPGAPRSLNKVGLQRNGFSDETIERLKEAFSIVFRRGFGRESAIQKLESLAENDSHVKTVLQALISSKRGIARFGEQNENSEYV